MLHYFFWVIPGVWILSADVSEHSVCSIFIGGASWKHLIPAIILDYTAYEDGTEFSETSYRFQTPVNHPKERIQIIIYLFMIILRKSFGPKMDEVGGLQEIN
jgi:hypothetical protein